MVSVCTSGLGFGAVLVHSRDPEGHAPGSMNGPMPNSNEKQVMSV